jgi:hypothetical protein
MTTTTTITSVSQRYYLMPSVLGVILMIRKLEFNRVLAVAKLDSKKEGMERRQITLHSFRRLVKTVTSN